MDFPDILPPIVPTYEMALQDFKDKTRFYLDFNSEGKKFKTKKGDYVRSKSEKIIADLLYDYGLEYVYEAGITLDYKEYFPDFTVFHPIKRQEIYWEHFGILNDYDYSVNTYKKIMNYELNGYLTNDRLIVTMEYQIVYLFLFKFSNMITLLNVIYCFHLSFFLIFLLLHK